MSSDPRRQDVSPRSAAVEPGPKEPPHSWERSEHPILTRETLARLAPAGLLLLVVLVVFSAAMAIVSPESAAVTVGATILAVILVPVILSSAMSFGDLPYGKPRPVAWQVGPAGIRRIRSRGAGALPGPILAAPDAADAVDEQLPGGGPAPEIEALEVPWRDVLTCVFNDGRHTAGLGYRSPVGATGLLLTVYCGPEDWPQVRAWVQWGVEEGDRQRRRAASRDGSIALPR